MSTACRKSAEMKETLHSYRQIFSHKMKGKLVMDFNTYNPHLVFKATAVTQDAGVI